MRRQVPSGVLALSALRGLAPREGLVLLMLKLGRTRPSMETRGGPQVKVQLSLGGFGNS